MNSPEAVQTSLAAAITLGLERGRFNEGVRLTGLNLLLTYEDGCKGSCSYCGLSRQREAAQKTFIRVKWPTYSLEEVLSHAKEVTGQIRRVCVGMLTHRQCLDDARMVIRRFRAETDLKISALITPTLFKEPGELAALRDAGADRMAVAVDAATPELFERHRGRGIGGPHRWEHYWRVLDWGVAVFGPGMAGVHLVVGLGETEEEMIRTIQSAHDRGSVTHLFSFFPEEGSALADWPQPPLGQYRRVQLARYLIDEGLGHLRDMRFNARGQLTDFGRPVGEIIARGVPFMTSGCPDETGTVACNRPYGNERPSERFRNFPYRPTAEEVVAIEQEIWADLEPDYASRVI